MEIFCFCRLFNGIHAFIFEQFSFEFVVYLLLFLIAISLVIANYRYANNFFDTVLSRSQYGKYEIDYTATNGPKHWKEMFPAARGKFQSPINIQSETAIILKIREYLSWNNYDDLPAQVFLKNTGHTVELTAKFSRNVPTVSGADLLESYSFVSLCFRWSLLDDEGSEHQLNNKIYPLELQVAHISTENTLQYKKQQADLGILMISYFYSLTRNDNPYLDPIIRNLCKIQKPGTIIQIPSFPLSWLCFPFRTHFYSYGGSLTEPPCSEGVTWFIHPDSVAISFKQITQFRTLMSNNGLTKIFKNSRPIQKVNSRVICFNRYDFQNKNLPTACPVVVAVAVPVPIPVSVPEIEENSETNSNQQIELK